MVDKKAMGSFPRLLETEDDLNQMIACVPDSRVQSGDDMAITWCIVVGADRVHP